MSAEDAYRLVDSTDEEVSHEIPTDVVTRVDSWVFVL